jgi:hypothetical protein
VPFARFKSISAFGDGWLLLIAALANAALFSVVLSLLSLSYESNDDIGMAHIASGLLTGKPSADLVFTNLLVGTVLKPLYQWSDRVNWYTLYLLAAHFLSMTGLLFAFLRIRSSLLSFGLFMLLFAEYEVGLLLWLQYTSVAMMAAVVGCLLLTGFPRSDLSASRAATGYGGGLLVLAGVMRSDALFFALIVIGPFLAARFMSLRRWRPALTMAAFGAVVLAAIGLSEWHYRSDPRWRDYRIVNAALIPVLDTQSIEYNAGTRPFFDSLGWSAADWRMMRSWFFADPEVFTTERMGKMAAHFRQAGWQRPHAWGYLENRLSPLIVFERMTYANMLLAFLLCGGRRLRLVLLGGFQGLWVVFVFFLLALFWKIEPRIAMPASFALAVIVFELVLEAARERALTGGKMVPTWMPRPMWAVCLLAVAACYGWATYRMERRHWTLSALNRRSQTEFRELVQQVTDRYIARDPDAIFLNWGATFPFQFTPPFDANRQVARMRIVSLGWNQHSPLFEERLETLGVRRLGDLLSGNPHVFLFMAPAGIETLEQFVKEHYRAEIVPRQIDVLTAENATPPAGSSLTLPVVQMIPRTKAAGRTPTP